MVLGLGVDDFELLCFRVDQSIELHFLQILQLQLFLDFLVLFQVDLVLYLDGLDCRVFGAAQLAEVGSSDQKRKCYFIHY